MNKFHARKARGVTTLRMYDSQAERDYRDGVLNLREQLGEIRNIVEQPKVQLTKYHTYKPDFLFEERDGDSWRPIYVDVKGPETDRFRINVKLWKQFGPALLRIVKRAKGRAPFQVTKEIRPD